MPTALAILPSTIAVPAAAAGLAYLNARSALWYDLFLVRSVVPAALALAWFARTGRVNIFYRLEHRAKSPSTANRPFLLFEDHAYTYAQVYDRALRYGAWWKEKRGVQKDEVVAIDFMNSDTFLFLWLGLWAIGAKPAFINYNLRDHALVHCAKTANTRLLLIDPAVAEALTPAVRAGLPDMQLEVFLPATEAEARAMDATRYPDELLHETNGAAAAVLIFTSGTTGLPKAAVVSWAKLMTTGNFSLRWMGITKDDIYYTCMPLYHSSACLFCVSTVLHASATMALGRRFSNKTFWPDVRKFHATVIQYVGETCRYLLAAPPQRDPVTHEDLDRKHAVRIAFGNGLRPDVWNRFKERFGIETIAEFYGATEGSMAIFNLSKNDFTMGAVGRSGWLYDLVMGHNVVHVPVDWATEMPLRDLSSGFSRRCKRGEPGELLFRLPAGDISARFQGYYGNRQASEAKVLRNVFRRGDAWLRTGDVMMRDAEGRTYFVDRIGDTFRWKSENVSTTEVAQAVGLHPDVLEANVYGVALPHHDGRAGCVALVLRGPPTPALLQSLAGHVEHELPRFAQPLFLRVVQDTSAHTTGTNKQQKNVLREQGADPDKVGTDQLFWLQGNTYVPFARRDWDRLQGGQVKL
ncbi:long-chain-fatty-acid-ligase 1 [Niveomyces insectorum RCEF 264]|uniref:Very long-chain fatty acid transport protein n=1 Tax=Niveomyces insectorum RCEF 264 TaxID=1081102 RepID=A0A162KBY1_9HYPO|nr:long-chain-fatty-acid-ligase 1 [Niveomyces insectorum RCEF 264]